MAGPRPMTGTGQPTPDRSSSVIGAPPATDRSTPSPSYALAIELGRRVHRARHRLDEGRRPRRAARERDRRHDRRRQPSGVRGSADDEDDRRCRRHRLVHRGLHARRAQDAAGEGTASPGPARQRHLRRPIRDPDAPGGDRPGQARRPAPPWRGSGSIPRRSTRPTSTRSTCRSRSRSSRRSTRTGIGAELARVHPVVRGRQPPGPCGDDAACRSSSCSTHRRAVRLRRVRGPANLCRSGHVDRAGIHRRLRGWRRRQQGPGDPPGRGRQPAHRDVIRRRRARGRAGGPCLDVPCGEHVPADEPSARRSDRSDLPPPKGRLRRRIRGLLRCRPGRRLADQPDLAVEARASR